MEFQGHLIFTHSRRGTCTAVPFAVYYCVVGAHGWILLARDKTKVAQGVFRPQQMFTLSLPLPVVVEIFTVQCPSGVHD